MKKINVSREETKMICPRCGNILEARGGLYWCNTRGCDVVTIEIHYKQPFLNAFVKEALKK